MTDENDNAGAGETLLDWLLRRFPDTPRSRARQWIQAGRVTLDGVVLRRPHQVIPEPGDRMELLQRGSSSLECGLGWQIHPRVAVLHLDAAVAVVNKGPGLVSVPAANCRISALSVLADFLAGRLRAPRPTTPWKSVPPAYRRLQPLPVHRLDQYTSGVFCMALNPIARRHLIAQASAHTMNREYVAFLDGRPATPTGTWREWVRLGDHDLRQHVVSEAAAREPKSGAEQAITHYEVVEVFPLPGGRGFVTKLRLQLETGLKHQIRVQAVNAGLPLIGDRAYHPKYRTQPATNAPIDFPRQALHSEVLTLEHPDQPGVRMTWRAEMPKDLRQLEAALRSHRV